MEHKYVEALREPYYSCGKIDSTSWWIQDSLGGYCYLLEGTKKAALIDSGIGLPGLKECIGNLTKKPIILLLTHGHLDHIGGIGIFRDTRVHQSDLKVLKLHSSSSYRSCIEKLLEEGNKELPMSCLKYCINLRQPEQITQISDGEIIDLGEKRIEVIATPGHTEGSVCFLERETGRLFSGDSVCAWRVMLSFPESSSLKNYKKSMLKIKSHSEIKSIYPGHHQSPISKGYCDLYIECIDTLFENIELTKTEISVFGTYQVYQTKTVEVTFRADNERTKKEKYYDT